MKTTSSRYGAHAYIARSTVPHVMHLYFRSTANNNLLLPGLGAPGLTGAGDVSDLCQQAEILDYENVTYKCQNQMKMKIFNTKKESIEL